MTGMLLDAMCVCMCVYVCVCIVMLTVTLALMLHTVIQVVLNATGSEHVQELGADFKIASCLRMILLTIPLVAQALLAYAINIYPKKYCCALQNARVSAVSSAAALALPPRGVRVEDEEEGERQAREDARANLETA